MFGFVLLFIYNPDVFHSKFKEFDSLLLISENLNKNLNIHSIYIFTLYFGYSRFFKKLNKTT